MKKILRFLINVITTKDTIDITDTEQIRLGLTNFISIQGLIVIAIYLIANLGSNSLLNQIAFFAIALFFLITLIITRLTKESTYGVMIITLIILVASALTLPADLSLYNSLYWVFVMPPIAFLLHGKTRGIIVNLIILSVLLVTSLLGSAGLFQLNYNVGNIAVFFLAISVETALIYIYQLIRDTAVEKLSSQINLMSKSNDKLQSILKQNDEFQHKLSASFEDLKNKNNELQNQKLAMINLIEDIEEEKKISEGRAETLKQFKEAVDNANQHIVFTDTNGLILYANKAVESTTGYASKEILGKTPAVWGAQMTDEFYEKFWRTIKEEKKPFSGEFTNRNKSGDLYVAQAQVFPILDKENNVKFFVGLERDITKEKEIDEMKTEFVSVASHQLKTPLTGIKWFIEILISEKAGPLNTEQKNMLADIQTNSERMINLVNDLLNVSRIETGKKFNINKKPEDIGTLIQEEIHDMEVQSYRKNIRIIAENFPQGLIFSFDRNKIKQVLYNILDNAIKYSPENTTISISVSQNTDTFIELAIKDQGFGIPQAEQQNVFKKFFRASNAIKFETNGTGLGLHIVQEIVKSHGGTVRFESKPDQGTTFFIQLPKA